MNNTIPELRVAAAVMMRGKRIFMQQRSKGDYAMMWEIPGGKIENGRTAAETLQRELHEELGAPGRDMHLLGTVAVDTMAINGAWYKLRMDVFLVDLADKDQLSPREGQPGSGWFTLLEAAALSKTPGTEAFLDNVGPQGWLRSLV